MPPLQIGRVFDSLAGQIGLVVGPPDRPALAEGDLCAVHTVSGGVECRGIIRAPGVPHGSTGGHQFLDPLPSFFLIQPGVRRTPQHAIDHDVPAVRRLRRL